MKKILLLFILPISYSFASGTHDIDLGDGYQTIIPCFRFNVKTPNGVTGKFEYALLSNNEIIQKGNISTNDDKANYIQWCDNKLTHVQKKGALHNISNKYTLVINGIQFRNLIVGSKISINNAVRKSNFGNGYFICHNVSQSGSDCRLDPKDDSLDYPISIKYNDILAIDNSKVTQVQYGTGVAVKNSDGLFDPRRGSFLTFQHSDRNTDYSFSIFRKLWTVSDLIIPTSISNYHPLNTRNLKLEATIGTMDYTKELYDDNDYNSQGMIDYNFKQDPVRYFAGFCSGVGVIDGVIYASCRNNIDIYGPYSTIPTQFLNMINQFPTSLSYMTACNTVDYDFNGHKIKVALLNNDSNGALKCVSYKADFPQGEYLNSCPGINYDPDNRILTTECYDNNTKLVHHVAKLGSIGQNTPRYKNVNGILVAY